MPPPPRRKLALKDAMILIAATAIGLAFLRNSFPHYSFLPAGRTPIERGLSRTFVAAFGMSPLLASWTIATLGLGLRGRHFRRRVPPGMVACLSATFGFGLVVIQKVNSATWLARRSGLRIATGIPLEDALGYLSATFDQIVFLPSFVHSVGYTVAGAWLALVVVRRWCPEPTWYDRTGRLLGLYWIALIPLELAESWINS